VIALFLATAQAAEPRGELSLEMSTVANHDEAYDLFHESDGMGLPGVRVGYRVVDRVAVQAAWGALRTGAEVTAGTDTRFIAAMTAHQVRLGAKADVPLVEDVFYPSISAAGVAMPTLWRFDGDPTVRDPLSQVRQSGLPLGFELLGGAELRVRTRGTWTAAAFLDLGGTWLSRAQFGDLGDMKPGGFTAHGGFGLRF
jgi:hypothetical protein